MRREILGYMKSVVLNEMRIFLTKGERALRVLSVNDRNGTVVMLIDMHIRAEDSFLDVDAERSDFRAKVLVERVGSFGSLRARKAGAIPV